MCLEVRRVLSFRETDNGITAGLAAALLHKPPAFHACPVAQTRARLLLDSLGSPSGKRRDDAWTVNLPLCLRQKEVGWPDS